MSIDAIGASGCMPAGFGGMSGMRRPDPEQMAEMASDKIMEKKDTSGDGMLSLEEMGEEADQELFAKVDADGDGLITKDELKTGLTNHREEFMSGVRAAMSQNGGMPDMGGMQQMRQAANAYENPADALMSMLFDTESEVSVSV